MVVAGHERVHKVRITENVQALKFRFFRAAAEQIRFSQSKEHRKQSLWRTGHSSKPPRE